MKMYATVFSLLLGLMLLAPGTGFSADSPQFRGPDRSGIFPETGLLKVWPEEGPPLLWTATGLGHGYASLCVVGDRIFVPGTLNTDDGFIFVLTLDGVVERQISYGKETQDGQAPGSRCTPTIEENRLYILSGLGTIYCIDLKTDAIIWQVNILDRFGGENNTWNLAESLLIDGDRLICTPGGPDAGVAALDKMTGETVWTTRGLSDQASYCSPVIVTHGSRRLLLTETAKLVVGIDADSGALLWTHEHPTDYDIHAVTPVYHKGLVYFSGGYGSGGGALELAPDGSSVSVKWTDKHLDCQHHGVVLIDGHIYGTGHKNSKLVCLEMATGTLKWETREVKQGVVIAAEGMLYVYEGPKAGVVSLVKATPAGFERTGSFKVTQGSKNHWAHPVIADKRLYIRRGDALMAYNIAFK